MKRLIATIIAILLSTSAVQAATIGTIDPNNTGHFKAVIENAGLGSATTINFGKFTTQSAKNITVSSSELRGYAWGEGVGWIVMNCADTTSGCTGANGNFKVANDGAGNLSGYAWGENTGWINFGPFNNNTVSRVKITNGLFGGTSGSAGYAWAETVGWIKFDCSSAVSCVETDWRPATTTPPGGGGPNGGGGNPPVPVCTDVTALNLGGALPCLYPTTPTICTDNTATNFGGALPCVYTTPVVCSDPSAVNVGQPGACTYPQTLCADPSALNIGGSLPCQYPIPLCVQNPNDPSCTGVNPPTLTFCEQYPELCVPPNGPTRSQVISSVVAGSAAQFVGSTIQKIASATGIAAVGIASIAMFFVANPFSLFDILLWISRLWSLLLVAFGIKKKANPWGTVYDSVTKQPIDPAYVVLYGADGKEIATSITDIEGRYGFAVPPGTYTIVANKTNYVFPSTKLAGKIEDELYNNLYFGGQIVVEKDGDIIGKNIPMDAVGFDWNEYAKDEQRRLRHFHRRDVLIARISNGLFIAGFIITGVAAIVSPTVFNLVMISIYLILAVLQILGISVRPTGGVTDYASGMPVPFSVVRVYSTATNKEIMHRVADVRGRYYALMANGTYRVVVDRKNPDQSYTPTPITGDIPVKRGYLKELFKI